LLVKLKISAALKHMSNNTNKKKGESDFVVGLLTFIVFIIFMAAF